MDEPRIPLEVDAEIPPGAFQDLAVVLEGLGYDPRPGSAAGGSDGGPAMVLKAGQALTPEATKALINGVVGWIQRRPAPKGRFRKRKAPPVTVTISGPGGDVLATVVVHRR